MDDTGEKLVTSSVALSYEFNFSIVHFCRRKLVHVARNMLGCSAYVSWAVKADVDAKAIFQNEDSVSHGDLTSYARKVFQIIPTCSAVLIHILTG